MLPERHGSGLLSRHAPDLPAESISACLLERPPGCPLVFLCETHCPAPPSLPNSDSESFQIAGETTALRDDGLDGGVPGRGVGCRALQCSMTDGNMLFFFFFLLWGSVCRAVGPTLLYYTAGFLRF